MRILERRRANVKPLNLGCRPRRIREGSRALQRTVRKAGCRWAAGQMQESPACCQLAEHGTGVFGEAIG
ncbi:hypothetical protein TVNIR_0367 [Thioalkalivibrio nitratireducens DSM 14787]|uniref:Uncharacterized protein n=1 Tax=Thioalkalivibrio nitratireducens (strain DSM 14787 / UNIQEM 213 / ALEN2) TaxID=1255043 RepID=L0DSW3_THIND|nr:hypothetical protein TVNIR_0367 [Thioalkalivibrio nitratireducens DSM 14787]